MTQQGGDCRSPELHLRQEPDSIWCLRMHSQEVVPEVRGWGTPTLAVSSPHPPGDTDLRKAALVSSPQSWRDFLQTFTWQGKPSLLILTCHPAIRGRQWGAL